MKQNSNTQLLNKTKGKGTVLAFFVSKKQKDGRGLNLTVSLRYIKMATVVYRSSKVINRMRENKSGLQTKID